MARDHTFVVAILLLIAFVSAVIIAWGIDRKNEFKAKCRAAGGEPYIGRGIKLCLDPRVTKKVPY